MNDKKTKAREARHRQDPCPNTLQDLPTITHLPSPLALKSWLEVLGGQGAELREVYTKGVGWQQAVLADSERAEGTRYVYYDSGGDFGYTLVDGQEVRELS